jgi:hypothetical protein
MNPSINQGLLHLLLAKLSELMGETEAGEV